MWRTSRLAREAGLTRRAHLERGAGRTLRAWTARIKAPAPALWLAIAALASSAWLACAPAPTPETSWGSALAPSRLELGPLVLRPAALVPIPSGGSNPAPAFLPPPAPALSASPSPSLSIGPPNRGELLAGQTLTPRRGLDLLPSAQRRGATAGTPGLIGLLTRAAARVEREFPGSTLWVGDLSLADGGPFPPHASHQNGRDVDLAFYLATPDGALADEPAMRQVAPDGGVGGTGGAKRFDTARNWALIEALLEDPAVQVQWIFVAPHLRERLLQRARELDSPLTARAERVLFTPRDSSPHADHFHVRIYCGLDERLEGCLDAPPFHPWVDRHEDALARWLDGLSPFLDHPHRPEIDFAIERIVRMNATAALPRLDALSAHPDPAIAALARDARAFLSGHRSRAAWERWRPTEVGH